MLPFGPRLTTVFASRWKALLWAAGVMVSAYFAIPHGDDVAPDDTAPDPASSAGEAASSTSPWAK